MNLYKHATCLEGCWENPGQGKAGTVTKVSSLAVTQSVKIAAAPEWRFYAEKEAALPFCTSAMQCTIKQN